ncbi:MAG: hypothetical protein E7099_02425 [Mediterranea massiliensis]|nr:hypothetical protein [Mediterranea massiliensis]
MKKKIIIIITALIGMSCILGMLDFLLDSWETRGWFRRIISFAALLGWVYITYNMITLKYKWIRRLAK